MVVLVETWLDKKGWEKVKGKIPICIGNARGEKGKQEGKMGGMGGG